ncbi:PhoX family phosphatase [Aquabacterium sp. A08]|uniref:PhoX family protein n=1 Tax=Aquabacterium sp. A08 TaxID=2718532 RepID=UPI001422BC56|nr:PhoX family phosphatase [Aquabacterium sp. A08]NIC41796.1 PhoX family phosphatase [Aquabacterium sp. A08]NIC41822.1 PhoX family phosphatase [Aquabacterium sp. A08]NIC43493.1 PhoX family phosphatase [Aquabacterium sp. A08]
MTHELRPGVVFNEEDSNTSPNPAFEQVLQARLSRRSLLRSGAGVAGATALGATALSGCATGAPAHAVNTLGFKAVSKHVNDVLTVPEGYTAQVLYGLGDPLSGDTPAFKNDGTDTDWGRRAGDHHDGIEWFSLDANSQPSNTFNSRGLLAMNHEATTDEKLTSFFIHADGGKASLPRPAAEVDKELMIHGLSVVEVQSNGKTWSYKTNSPFNRRVTTMTEAVISGPARGSTHLVTKYSADGTRARGTLNNCGTGKTPWGTFVSGEENWFGYFFRDAQDDDRRKKDKQVQALNRYGRKAGAASRHGWESGGADDRFVRWNNGALAASAQEDYRNEMNTFGYVVELDPYNPKAVLRKRTALGRMGHENVTFAKPVAGQPVVAYMGDDARGEYIYKFVSHALWDPADAKAANRLTAGDKYLDQGTLFAARFKEDGSGEWLALSVDNPVIAHSSYFEFKDNADVAIFTRLAADAVGATKMDRPEWGGVNPRNGEVYFTLTNNSNRTAATADAANPRVYTDLKGRKEQTGNVHGHIVRFMEPNPAATTFKWDIYLFASEADADQARVNLSGLTDDNDLSSPDGLVFSPATGICWIQTDDGAYTDKTNCMLLAALPGQVGDGGTKTLQYGDKTVTTYAGKTQTPATLKRFLVGPRGAEITGICETPDGRAMFVNIQHPGENTQMADVNTPARYESQWPANAGYGPGQRPRSATVVITKNDGGVIGS